MNLKQTLLLISIITFTALCLAPTNLNTTQSRHLNGLHVIFDLNGVLIHNEGEAKILGMGKLVRYALLHGFNTKKRLRQKLFEFLATLEPHHAGEAKACDNEGNILPQITCDWLKGTKKPAQLLAMVENGMAQRSSGLENTIIHSVATMMFDPEQFVQTQKWSQESLAFVQELRNQGCKVYILSNWDPASFAIMLRLYPHIFSQFDGIVISGQAGKIKPDTAIFEYCLTQFNIPRELRDFVLFVDDQLVNTGAAGSVGLANFTFDVKKGLAPLRTAFFAWKQRVGHRAAQYA